MGYAVKPAKNLMDTPIYWVGEPMMRKAVRIGINIGLVATLSSTLNPSSKLIVDIAEELGKKVTINIYVKAKDCYFFS